MADRNKLYREFFRTKTIQRTDRFSATIQYIDKNISNSSKQLQLIQNQMKTVSGPMPPIREYHVVNVTIPTYEFKKEIMPTGVFPKTVPVLEHQGFELTVMFEDDDYGTITRFVNWCQRRIISPNGFYYPHRLSTIGNMYMDTLNEQNEVVYRYEFKDIYFLRSTPVTWDYSNSVSQKLSITFGSDSQIFYTNDNLKPLQPNSTN